MTWLGLIILLTSLNNHPGPFLRPRAWSAISESLVGNRESSACSFHKSSHSPGKSSCICPDQACRSHKWQTHLCQERVAEKAFLGICGTGNRSKATKRRERLHDASHNRVPGTWTAHTQWAAPSTPLTLKCQTLLTVTQKYFFQFCTQCAIFLCKTTPQGTV